MKKNTTIIAVIAIAIIGFCISGCKKDKDNEPTERELSFHLHTLVGNTIANYNDVFSDNTGRKFKIDDCRLAFPHRILLS